MINKIEKCNLVDEAYKQIYNSITEHVWAEGEKIPSENQLCKLLNVSRIVVREALQRLRTERWIVTYQGVGSFVANPQNFEGLESDIKHAPVVSMSYQEFRDVMEFRACIEYSAIKRAVAAAGDEELKACLDLAEEMEQCQEDPEAFTQADYDFHMQILRCSQNKMYYQAMESCVEKVQYCLGIMNSLNDSRRWAVGLHREIGECLCRRDGKAAIELLKKNGEYNLARMSQFFPDAVQEEKGREI
ncbi:MAG: FadR family transcriptional regulator [Lachnospiraceae bacterium]|jgi:GntR family transcriptional repressor for pyruvate dehydrogenase complex|nr:FadR family transcriptional regulator [Lachnospiraceae bacterium]MCI8996734.1 FadR family transcriptional regulator [Lachnospiraceae bacterium]MCI9133714.1 FadR family transcriptional regulator [Lachnospiraceae bacterium]